jgi:hypothetical protein
MAAPAASDTAGRAAARAAERLVAPPIELVHFIFLGCFSVIRGARPAAFDK